MCFGSDTLDSMFEYISDETDTQYAIDDMSNEYV